MVELRLILQRHGENEAGTIMVGVVVVERTTLHLGTTTNKVESNAQSLAVVVELEEWDEDTLLICFSDTNTRVCHSEGDGIVIILTA